MNKPGRWDKPCISIAERYILNKYLYLGRDYGTADDSVDYLWIGGKGVD